jgi:hypothetical protein
MPDMNDAERLAEAADRLDELADTAELMGDDANSIEMRDQASRLRMAAMNLIPPLQRDTD